MAQANLGIIANNSEWIPEDNKKFDATYVKFDPGVEAGMQMHFPIKIDQQLTMHTTLQNSSRAPQNLSTPS